MYIIKVMLEKILEEKKLSFDYFEAEPTADVSIMTKITMKQKHINSSF